MTAQGGESAAWMAAYHSQALRRRRWKTYARKLHRLGLVAPARGRTLDIACGSGEALALLADLGFEGLYGLDLAVSSRPAGERFRFILGDGASLPLGSGTFDQVLCLHALHHFGSAARLEHLLVEVHRVLRPDGGLYLVDHFDSWYLRLIFRLCEIECPLYPAAVKHFGVQLREERECLHWWLDQWQSIFPALERAGFAVQRFTRRAFFFYIICRPR